MNSLQHAPSPLVTPLLALWHWLMARPGSGRLDDRTRTRAHNPAQMDAARFGLPPASKARSVVAPAARRSAHTGALRPQRPLRVLQVVEAGQNPGCGSRLRISGRMADVCAELDRLAAREALLH